MAVGDITIGDLNRNPILTVKQQTFQAVTGTCLVTTSGCTDSTASEEQQTLGGVFGIRPSAGSQGILSILAQLAPPLNSGFVVSFADRALRLGQIYAANPQFQVYSVSPAPIASPIPYWINTSFPWSYSITDPDGTLVIQNQTIAINGSSGPGVLTDTGGLAAHLYFAAPIAVFAAIQANLSTATPLPQNFIVTATLGQIQWELTTGRSCSNTVDVWYSGPSPEPTPSGTSSSNGIDPYFTNDVLYDVVNGFFGFYDRGLAPPAC